MPRSCAPTMAVAVALLAAAAVAPLLARPAEPQVPRVIKYSGSVPGASGLVSVTFSFFADQQIETPLWEETQTVVLDESGRYTVSIGTSRPDGLPPELFASGDARWLGVQVSGRPALPRVMLVSVPYALKASDAETIGGKPLSAFVLAGSTTGTGPDGLTYVDTRVLKSDASAAGQIAQGTGSAGYLGVFTDSINLGNSVAFQSGTSIGVGTTAPAAPFHAVGAVAPAAIFDVYSNSLTALPVVYRAARGTPASPSAVQANDILGGLAVRGYGATAFTSGRGQVMFKAAENWTDAANGTYLQFTTTPIGGTGWVERMRLGPEGYLGLNAPAPRFPLDIQVANGATYLAVGAHTPGGLFLVANNPSIGFNLSYPSGTNWWTRNGAGSGGYLAFGQDGPEGSFSIATVGRGAAGSTATPAVRLVVANTGEVGIGTTAPSAALDVAGVVKATTTTGFGAGIFTDSGTDGTGLTGRADTGTNAWGVFGTSSGGIGVYGSGNAVAGVYGVSFSGIGVRGTSGSVSGTGGLFQNTAAGKAISATVNGVETMAVDAAGVHAGPAMTPTPIAHGTFSSAGARLSGSTNISCGWDGTKYVCTIDGETYFRDSYTTIVTPVNSVAVFPATNSSVGRLWVTFYNLSGASTQPSGGFSVVVFKQ